MKIYTKTGDKGKTALVGGTRVAKNHFRIEAYGTADELNSNLGYLRDLIENKADKDFLCRIQEDIMVLSAILSADREDVLNKLPMLSDERIKELEKEIDRINESLPVLKYFVLPGGHTTVSVCHICRTICRRTERRVYDLLEHVSISESVTIYLNRLSDYLFILARKLSAELNADEIIWNPVLDK